jgi:hypothetical protein
MAVSYELWSMTSRNLLASFRSEADALAAVREALERNGAEYVNGLALGREDERGGAQAVAHGAALLERALHDGAVNGASSRSSAPSAATERSA